MTQNEVDGRGPGGNGRPRSAGRRCVISAMERPLKPLLGGPPAKIRILKINNKSPCPQKEIYMLSTWNVTILQVVPCLHQHHICMIA